MILELSTEAVQIHQGFLTAEIRAKTEKGEVAMRIAFELRKHPGLDSLIPMIDDEVRKACVNLGMTKSVLPDA